VKLFYVPSDLLRWPRLDINTK